jgi:hypothetical protein
VAGGVLVPGVLLGGVLVPGVLLGGVLVPGVVLGGVLVLGVPLEGVLVPGVFALLLAAAGAPAAGGGALAALPAVACGWGAEPSSLSQAMPAHATRQHATSFESWVFMAIPGRRHAGSVRVM